MTKLAIAVKEYWSNITSLIHFDPEILQLAIDTLGPEERAYILSHKRDLREFTMNKVFNRHNDLCNGSTTVENGAVCASIDSSITELDISYSTLLDCNKNAIYKISDLGEEIIPSLQYASIQEANEALLRFVEE